MEYRELLELYKQGRLDEHSKQQVEKDIERQEAITDFLIDLEEQSGIGAFGQSGFTGKDVQGVTSPDGGKEDAGAQPDFVRLINRSIRRAFIKIGAGIVAFTLAAVLFVMHLLPKVVDRFYYDPGESIEGHGNQMSLDLAVYTELCMPGVNRDNVSVQNRGYGIYDIMIHQGFSYNGSFTNLPGRIEKGSLTLYDANLLNRPAGNVFAWFQMEGDSTDSLTTLIGEEKKTNYCTAGNKDDAAKRIHELDEHTKYIAYVTLDKMMPYEEFIEYWNQFCTEHPDSIFANVWCTVCTSNGIASAGKTQGGLSDERFYAENLGFNCELEVSHDLGWDKKAYPELLLWGQDTVEAGIDEELEEGMRKEDFMKVHFISMLRYMADQEDFLAMMHDSPQSYREAADYVEENGLMVYGFAGIGDKDAILQLGGEEAVYEVYTKELR